MIHIKDNYYLDADERQFILVQVREGVNQKTKKATRTEHKTFYPSVELVIKAALERELYDLVASGRDLDGIIDQARQWARSVEKTLGRDLRDCVRAARKAA